MPNKKYTIKDIAELAGVSKGTVDRVLHKRGKVSEKALNKVEQVIKEIDFQPNPIARNLKNNKLYKICVLMPDPKYDPYWVSANQGIIDASNEFKPFGISVEKCLYHLYDGSSFAKASQKAMDFCPDAILIVPLFQEELRQVLNVCRQRNIMVTLFDNYLEEFTGEIFIGQDLTQSGRVAASLLHKVVGKNDEIAVVHVDLEPHMELKEKGFVDYFNENSNDIAIITKSFSTKDTLHFKHSADNFFQEHPMIKALFITNSKAYEILEVLPEMKKMIIVGYDLLQKNIDYLKKGKIDFLIHQKPKRQAYLGIAYLAEHFLFQKRIPKKELLPIDIITSENVDYYIIETSKTS
ncbi:substrate-binding domain-containing protein [Maribacter algicola]|uniref:Substrate-binding domain-containing protein n=1 Tax=Meishania litoralis TaxID=3434685 RepID=A0ACC7LKA8_9FLAO